MDCRSRGSTLSQARGNRQTGPGANRLGDPRYIAEPKFDGQRAQVHVAVNQTQAAYSRPGRSLLSSPGLGWLREARWPVASLVLELPPMERVLALSSSGPACG
jgi:hypothetical protein